MNDDRKYTVFKKVVTEIREAEGLDRLAFSRGIGVTRSYLSEMENGTRDRAITETVVRSIVSQHAVTHQQVTLLAACVKDTSLRFETELMLYRRTDEELLAIQHAIVDSKPGVTIGTDHIPHLNRLK